MKQYWPIFLALFCWLMVFLVPTTRLGTIGANDNWSLFPAEKNVPISSEHFTNVSWQTDMLLTRFPDDKNIETYAATEYDTYPYGDAYGVKKEMDYLAQRYPNDPYMVVLQLRNALIDLKADRYQGPIYNRAYPQALPQMTSRRSPRKQWDSYIATVRRGQKLEPNNSYFDWMLLYGLYATDQDEHARAVLKSAAKKTAFNAHCGDENLSSIEVYKRLYGAALPPIALFGAQDEMSLREQRACSGVASWTMELAMLDRMAGRHNRALQTTVDLMNLARNARRQSYSYLNMANMQACETTALCSSAFIPKMKKILPVKAPATYQAHPKSLYLYAKSQGREDIARAASANWGERWNWYTAPWLDHRWYQDAAPQLALISGVNRLRTMILWTLPVTLVLCAAFALVARRFPAHPVSETLFWRGGIVGIALLLLTVTSSTAFIVFNSLVQSLNPLQYYYSESSLLNLAWVWFFAGLPAILVCHGLWKANQWQKAQQTAPISLKNRFKNLASPTEDGLARFDFGWAVSAILRLTFWTILLAAIVHFCLSPGEWKLLFQDDIIAASSIMSAGLFLSLVAIGLSWRQRPLRTQTVRLGFRNVFQLLAGYFVAISAFYALLTFAILPLNLRVERDFEALAAKGEVQVVRSKLGL